MYQSLCLGLLLLTLTTQSAGGQVDPKDVTPIRIPGNQKAPEFADIDTWLNGEPLEMAKLNGKVVVMQFMAFG